MGEALRAALPGVDVSLSCEVQPEFREYERLSTTVLNAFLQPVAGRYMSRLAAAVERHAPGAGIGICQSSGGLMSIGAGRRDADPHRAVRPRRRRRRRHRGRRRGAGRRDLITFDMGGTSTDVCLVRDGKAEMAFGRSVAGSRCGCRRSISTPSVRAAARSPTSVATGSCASGPMSTGADPGPACYGKGGREPTVSDANLVLGRLPEELIGGGMRLDPRLAEEAIAPLAAQAGTVPARDGARHRAHRQRQHDARDPRRLDRARPRSPRLQPDALRRRGRAACRGNRARARHPQRLVPPAPGILCAEGVAAADLEESFVATCRVPLERRSCTRRGRRRPADSPQRRHGHARERVVGIAEPAG